MTSHRRAPPKIATSVSICRNRLEAAGASKINLSATLEQALIEKLCEAQGRQWREENSESMRPITSMSSSTASSQMTAGASDGAVHGREAVEWSNPQERTTLEEQFVRATE